MNTYITRNIRNIFITILFIIIGSIIINYAECRGKNQLAQECAEDREKEIKGVVTKMYFDDNINVKAFVIQFTNGKKYVNPIFEKSLSGYIEEGDSIYKAMGTFNFIIYKKGIEKPIFFQDSIDCNKLKD